MGNYRIYRFHFEEKDQFTKGLFAVFATIFATFFWIITFLKNIIASFDGNLLKEYVENGYETWDPTGYGFFVFLWYLPATICLAIAIGYVINTLLVLNECKKEAEQTTFETIKGFISFDKDRYETFSLAGSAIFTSLFIGLLYLIPNDLSYTAKVFGLYFLTFVGLSTFGFRYTIIEKWEKNLAKKEEKKAAKLAKKQQAKPVVKVEDQESNEESIQQIIHQAWACKEYQNKTFEEQLQNILSEAKIFKKHNMKTTIEDIHTLKRMLLEEVPAIVASYEELDDDAKNEFYQELKDCLLKIHEQLHFLNQCRSDMKKLGAKKIIEIIKERY